MKTIHCAGLIVIQNRRLLLAFSNNKQAWYLPGGKIDAGETALQAMQREVMEELNMQLPEDSLQYYMHVTAPAFGEKDNLVMEQDCFIHELQQTPQPSAEIGAIQFFDHATYLKEPHQVPGVLMVFEQLRADKLVD
ncbi:NUDIX hydrolase [Deminuibacter soli]|uniref:NUDIX domain-containing protein n=1 Tax=Deminuibacter soli TaxID=2291815 RepID=A0A3E1NIV9_9BACT|nr:NUDIX domain-containing protein [Deminuibacter soli]RFM27718.1 NUDIX domain-containing protein [Deminuibacter soli]